MAKDDRSVMTTRTTTVASNGVERVGQYLAYLYLLRVPLLLWSFLVVLPVVALAPGSSSGTLLRGIFDVAGESSLRTIYDYCLVTLASLLAGMTVAVTSRLILLDGGERFGAGTIPNSEGVALMFRLIPLVVAPGSIVVGIWREARLGGATPSALAELSGTVLGVVLFWMASVVHRWLWKAVDEEQAPPPSEPLDFARYVVRKIRPSAWEAVHYLALLSVGGLKAVSTLSPQGYCDGRQLRARHEFAALQFTISVLFYAILFVIHEATKQNEAPVIPTLCLVLVLVTMIGWAFSALTFFFDRFRIPLLLIVGGYAVLMSGMPQSDHFYRAKKPLVLPPAAPTASELLARQAGRPVILVATSGGGIQAEAWTARVLAGLEQDFTQAGLDFDSALTLVSGVSGGSVGAMFFLANGLARGGPPQVADLDDCPPVKHAQASSLDDVTFGLVYPDLAWTLFPFLKGIGRWHVLEGDNLTSDRGKSIEDAWMRRPGLLEATLVGWQNEVAAGHMPALIFNATIVETGERLLFSTTSLGPSKDNTIGRKDFRQLYPQLDVPIATAARLSATFPYITPAARVYNGDAFSRDFHVVDGGYYDNFGVSSLIEWMDAGILGLGAACPSKIAIVQIRASKHLEMTRPPRNQGGVFQILAPLDALMAVRDAAQLSRNEFAVNFVSRPGIYTNCPTPIEPFVFEYAGAGPDMAAEPKGQSGEDASLGKGKPAEVPLSWHLTPKEKRALHDEWSSSDVVKARRMLLESFGR
jgi:hypothetical protein